MKRIFLAFAIITGVFLGKQAVAAQYEAESATLSGGATTNTNHTGYTGTGFVEGFFNSTTAQASFAITGATAGSNTVTLRYSAGNGASSNTGLYVNGTKIKNISCPATTNWDAWANQGETVTLNAGNNTIMYKAETSSSSCINLDNINVNAACTNVAITTQPSNVTVTAPATQTFTIAASGTSPAYQWQQSTDGGTTYSNISGATSASYTTPATTTSMNGYRYRCYVSNSCPSNATSTAAILAVTATCTNVAITTQPSAASVSAPATATFTVAVSGTSPAYQWQQSSDGGTTYSNITGATSASYTTSATTTSMNGYRYRCYVSNSCPSNATSTAATLTVNSSSITYAYPQACGADENMQVDGQIKCNSLLIYNWLLSQNGQVTTVPAPDYVFENGYDLASLKEIKDYIKANGHLPGVPSAKELESSGVDMIKMNFILLKKIEEMTLHMIRQEEKIEKLEKRVK